MKLDELLRKTAGVDPGCSFDFESRKVHDQVEEVAKKLAAKYGIAKNCGRNRVTFEGKHVVIKLPRNDKGLDDNMIEANRYSRSEEKDKLARARLLDIGGVPVIVMIKVNTMNTLDAVGQKPKWADFFDCGQVGLTKQCKWRAYDYGAL